MWLWAAFIVFILFLLMLDLGVFRRKAHAITLKEALLLSGLWITVALVFNVFIYFAPLVRAGSDRARAGLRQYSLSYRLYRRKIARPDNVVAIAMIFVYFRIPPLYQHRVLFWGVVGALVMRAMMILAGVPLIERFDWILYLFGAFLIVSGVKMAPGRGAPDLEKNPVIALARELLPVTHNLVGERLAARIGGKFTLTPLAQTLIMIESSDLIFAVDSIPPIFAVTREPFLVFTSNIMAVLGLRSLYFALAGIIDRFRYLRLSHALLLALIGTKFILKDILPAEPDTVYYTLGAVTVILTGGVVASLICARRAPESCHVDIPARRKLVRRENR
jgi:tellurite resistance protein TerC